MLLALFPEGADCGQVHQTALPAIARREGGSSRTKAWRTPMPTKTTEKAGAKKTTAKKADAKPNALQKHVQPSKELAAVVCAGPLSRGDVVSKVWDYIKKNNLQNPQNKREILADDKLQPVFGKKKVTMFEMNKHLAQHLK